MFCIKCGSEVPKLAKFCPTCGNDVKKQADTSTTSKTSNVEEVKSPSTSEGKVKSFESFYKGQSKTRINKINNKNEKGKTTEVIITIGLLMWSGRDLRLKPLRGKRLPVRVDVSDPFSLLLVKSLDKWKTYNEELFSESEDYTLCFENGNECILMPGADDVSFNLKKYHDEIGKDYKRIVLYLCTVQDHGYHEYPKNQSDEDEVVSKKRKTDEEESDYFDQAGSSSSNQAGSSSSNQACSSSSDQACSSSSIPDTRQLLCPICHNKYPVDIIEEHANNCATKFDLISYSDNETEDDSLQRTFSYEEDNVLSQTDAISQRNISIGKLIESQDTGHNEVFKCRRHLAWEDFISQRQKPWSHVNNNIKVTFLKESAVDTGGPRREFFSECLKQMESSLFVSGMPVDSLVLLTKKQFLYAGQLMAMSVLQGGPLPNIMNECCYKIISMSTCVTPEDIQPTEEFLISDGIKEIVAATSEEEYSTVLMADSSLDLLSRIGYCGLPSKAKLETKENILRIIFYKINVEPRLHAIQQIADGLRVRGLLEHIRCNPLGFRECFLKSVTLKLERIFEEFEPNFVEKGNNRFGSQETVFKHFCDYLEHCYYADNSTHSVNDVCQFITGSKNIPILGFEKKITVEFVHTCIDGCRCLPEASTCALTLSLPVHITTLESMTLQMDRAIIEAPIFGNV